MTHSEQITGIAAICQRLGSNPEQAETMARQLLKRSEQLAVERGIKQVEALDHLLRLMISARQGESYRELPPIKGLKAGKEFGNP